MKQRLLLIGNSYTYYNELYITCKNILNEKNTDVEIETFTHGGAFLIDYINGGKYHDEFISFLKAKKFDYVIIQEQSLNPINNYDGFLFGATNIASILRSYNPEIKIFLYETWARHKDSSFYDDNKMLSYQKASYILADNYKKVGNMINAKIIYVGLAFYDICTNNIDIKLYQDDYSHPTACGSYLAALMFAKEIFNINPLDVNYIPTFNIIHDEFDKTQPTKKEATIIKKVANKITY